MIIRILYRIWSLLPILSVTRDDNFGYNKLGNSEGLRFSILNLMLGHTIYYFLTLRHTDGGWKFRVKEKLLLTESQWHSDMEGTSVQFQDKDVHIKALSKTYICEHKADPEDDLMAQKEFLLYLQNNNSQRKSLSYEKMNYYTTLVLVFLPLIPTFFEHTFSETIKCIPPFSILYWILFGFLMYMLINWGILVLQFMAVSGIEKSAFKDLKDPPEGRCQQEQLLYSYYFDWQEERFETNLRVAYVGTTEVFIKAAIILIAALMLLPRIAEFVYHPPRTNETKEAAHICSINTSQLKDPFSEDSIALSELHTQICKSRPLKILVFASSHVEAEDIARQYLQPYGEYVDIVPYADMDLEPHIFKIALLN